MARVASTTTTGVGIPDPTGGMTLDALMARQKELAARQGDVTAPRQISSPWQGIAQLAQSFMGARQEATTADQLKQGREQLAQLMGGINPETGATPQQIAQMGLLDPEAAQRATEAAAQMIRDRKAQEFQHGERVGTQEFTSGQTDKTIAEQEKLQTERLTAEQQAAALKRQQELQDPTTETGKIMRDFNAGIYGDPTSPDAAARRDAAITKATYIQPVNPALRFTPGQAEVDKNFAKDALDWKQSGGPNVQKTATQLGTAINILSKPGVIGPTGTLVGLGNMVLPDVAMKWLNPDGTIARDAVRESVQQTLRQTLGAQFTEKEGTDLMNRAFDPALKPEENIRRANLILSQITGIAQQKQAMVDYYDKNGTLVGYDGPTLDLAGLTKLQADWADPNAKGAGGEAGGGTDYKDGDVVSSPGKPDLVLKNGQWVPK